MIAFAEGAEIQYSHKGQNNWINWINKFPPSFDWQTFDYRIKPKQKYRPFETQEECWQEMHKHPDLGWVRDKKSKCYVHISLMRDYTDVSGQPYDSAFSNYTFTDDKPFGIKEE